jgi:putative phage-type endonuclease
MVIHGVEQGTDEWFSLRAGMPTASNFSKLVTSKGEPSKSLPTYANLLAAELYAQKPLNDFEGNQWTERGHELEDLARTRYEFQHDIDVDQVGFITDDNKLHGCSPDGLVGERGLIEIKCLKTENHVKAILYYQNYGRTPPDYIQQTQGQMFICERDWCDLVFYHPELPMLIIRQEQDAKIISALTLQLNEVRKVRDEVLNSIKSVINE